MLDHILDDASTSILDGLQTHLRYCIEHEQLTLPILPGTIWQLLPTSSNRAIDAPKLHDMLDQNRLLRQQILATLGTCAEQPQIAVVSIEQALDHVGSECIAVLAFTLLLREHIFTIAQARRQFQSLWLHAVATAVLAKNLNIATGRQVESAYVAGLLHDIGKPIILLTLLHTRSQALSGIPPMVTGAILEANHDEVGRIVAETWELEAEITAAIVYHHDYMMAPSCPRSATLIHLADAFAHHLLAPTIYTKARFVKHPAINLLNIERDMIEGLLADTNEIKAVVQAFEMR